MRRIRIDKLAVWVIVSVFSLLAIFPFYIMIVMGTHVSEMIKQRLYLLPGDYLVENLKTVFSTPILTYYWNSIFVAVTTTVGNVIISAAAGYGFAKYKFKGKKTLFFILIMMLMLPMQLGLIGFVIEMRYLSMMDSLWALIIPPMANAFNVFWMTQYIRSGVPGDIIESGRIDGSGELSIFIRLVFPIIHPATITVILLSFLNSWNNYFTPLVVINSNNKYTIPLGISMFEGRYRTDYAASILTLTIATLPVIILFAFFAKHLIAGLAGGSIKE